MHADNIEKIVKNLKNLPYRTILFDGAWGIGKSYAINEALKENPDVCKISMFGLGDAKQIYHEALFQLIIKNNIGITISEYTGNISHELSKFSKKVNSIKNIINSVVKEKELFLLFSKTFKSLHTIVIDDLERISSNVNLEEVLGIIEELKQCNNVKVILVINGEKLENKEIFEKYNEKVIDRIYHITERPQKIHWGTLGINAAFMDNFLKQHKVNNLRTLQKAQNFYDDVKLYCEDIKSVQFLEEIRLICFAIVVESTDNLYYKEPDEKEPDNTKRTFANTRNLLEYRILNYLTGIKSSKNLITMLFEYYKNEISLNIDSIRVEYKLFLQVGEKPNYYKTDIEIKRLLPVLFDKIEKADNLIELNKFADEYAVWSDIVGEDNILMIQKYKSKLHGMLSNMTMNGDDTSLSYDLWHFDSVKIKKLYEEERNLVKELMIKNLIKHLSKSTKDRDSFECSYRLRKYSDNCYYRDIIKNTIQSLYNKNCFPVEITDIDQYRTCYNIMYVLYHMDKEGLTSYCKKLVNECDKMAINRINVIMKELDE